jgi:hypothetical protein
VAYRIRSVSVATWIWNGRRPGYRFADTVKGSYTRIVREYYAFEVDPGAVFSIPVQFAIDIAMNGVVKETPVFGPVLLSFDRKTVNQEEIAEAAANAFPWMWVRSNPQLSDAARAFRESVVLPRVLSWVGSLRLQAKTAGMGFPVMDDYLNPDFASTRTTVTLSPGSTADFNVAELAVRWEAQERVCREAQARPSGVEGVTLNQCLAFMSEPEILDDENMWFCNDCRTHVRAKKELAIWSVPQILIIQLKRFGRQSYGQAKIDLDVAFPNDLDMTPYVVGPQKQGGSLYRLYAVSEHSGGLSGGHYTAHAIVRSSSGKSEWYSFCDNVTAPAKSSDAHSGQAYLLFYELATDATTGEQEATASD